MNFYLYDEIVREIRKPGKVYVGMLIKNDVAYVSCEKANLLNWLTSYSKHHDLPIYATREDGDCLYINNT